MKDTGIRSVQEANAADRTARELTAPGFQRLADNQPLTQVDKEGLRSGAEIYERIAKFQPDLWGTYYELGKIYRALGDSVRAEENLRQALLLAKKTPDMVAPLGDTHYLLAKGMYDEGRFAEALKEIQASLDIVPGNAEYLFVRAQCFTQLKRRAEAKKDLMAILKIYPGNPQAMALLKLVEKG